MLKTIILFSFCVDCTLELLPTIGIAWLLGCLFWWTFSKINFDKKQKEQLNEISLWKKKSKTLEEELSTLNFDWQTANTELQSLRNNYRELEIRYKALVDFKGTSVATIYKPVPPPNSMIEEMEAEDKKRIVYFSVDKSGTEKTTEEDRQKIIRIKKTSSDVIDYNKVFAASDLKIIEGIGTKLEILLKENGISTWTRLAVSSIDQLRATLAKAGAKYMVHDPSSWPQQASLARVGQWDELIRLQKAISKSNKSKVRKLYKKVKGAQAYRIDDLKIIEGVGPKIEQLLKDGGIDNWAKLATATVADIKQILKAAGDRYRLADPGTWSKQAALAQSEKWEELKTYQDSLKGGKELNEK